MCGRFALFSPPAAIAEFFRLGVAGLRQTLPPPSYNLAPGQEIPAICAPRRPACFTWGLTPSWRPATANRRLLINFRGETLWRQPACRQLARHRRCLVPANAFYEWRPTATGKRQPYLVRLPDQPLMALAGVWSPAGEKKSPAPAGNCAIITLPATGALQTIHSRQPALIARENFDLWLDSRTPITILESLLGEVQPQNWQVYPVSPRVNSPANNDPELLQPLSGDHAAPDRRPKLWDI